ncbi:HAD family hydrolase [Chloroflexota bacterium]
MSTLTVFFDVGGTLLDTPDLFETIVHNLTNNGSDEKTRDLVIKIFGRMLQNTEDYLSVENVITTTLVLLTQEYGYPDISKNAHNIYYGVFLHRSSLFPETRFVLNTLRNKNVRMIIASDADAEIMEKQLVKHNLKEYFVDVCTSGLIKGYKHSSRYVNYLRKYIIDNNDNYYFIGDNKVDVDCGRGLGIKSVLVDRSDSKKGIDADYIIHDLKEILSILGLK